ncbi:MAG: AAA family ATPase [Blautia sp.]|nr:AAA family ATPase [Blautia sp.]
MTKKSEDLLQELTEALFTRKALLLSGNTGVGKTFLSKKTANNLIEKKYNLFNPSDSGEVIVELVSCHNSVTYEDLVGGISVSTDGGKISFNYKERVLLDMLTRAESDYQKHKDNRYVLILDDIQRNELSSLLGDAIDAIGAESENKSISLNNGKKMNVPPNFYVIATCNPTENGAVQLSTGVLSKFYVKEILSDIEYITEDKDSRNAIFFDQVRSLVMNNLDMQYRQSTYEQNRFVLGHGYFSGEDVDLKVKYQLVPALKQYLAEGILDSDAKEPIRLLEAACLQKKIVSKVPKARSFSGYRSGVSTLRFVNEDSTRQCSSIPIENLVGRIIDQKLLTDDQIKNNVLFNKKVCYRETEVGGVTYLATLIANKQQYNKIRRSGKSDGRCLYNGGTMVIDGSEHHFTGGFHPRDYVKAACWENKDGYKLGESFGGNLVLYRIVWQYYEALITEFTKYLSANPSDLDKAKLLELIKTEWDSFLIDFKKIEPKSVIKAGRDDRDWKQEEAVYNQEANQKVRKRISELKILWSNPGDKLVAQDGTEILLEGVDSDMSDSIYKEYRDVMETLGIRQMILQGPPGTSKTYSAKAFLKFLAGKCNDTELADMQIADYSNPDKYCGKLFKGKGDPAIGWDIVQFHPSYGYEDFIRGIKVSTKAGSDTIIYETVNKVLGNIAELAKKHKGTKFYLIIDEINRANLATVFGELIYGLEYRTEPVATPYAVKSDNRISLPENLYIIGTMNTADKSIGGIDYAIRRRFLFFEQLPDRKIIEAYKADTGAKQADVNIKACRLFDSVSKLFDEDYLSPEYRREDVQIGHTYFLVDTEDKLRMRFEYQIIPILKEYYKDGIINFYVEASEAGFNGLLNCIAGKINMAAEKDKVDGIFNNLIAG